MLRYGSTTVCLCLFLCCCHCFNLKYCMDLTVFNLVCLLITNSRWCFRLCTLLHITMTPRGKQSVKRKLSEKLHGRKSAKLRKYFADTADNDPELLYKKARILVPPSHDPTMKAAIKRAVKAVWRTTKFLKEDPATEKVDATSLEKFLDDVLEQLEGTYAELSLAEPGFNEYWTEERYQQALVLRKAWVDIHQKTCLKELNNARTDVQAAVSSVMKHYYANHNALPDHKDIEKCATREIDTKKKEDSDLFLWYLTKLVPAAAGAGNFSAKCFKFHLLSEAFVGDDFNAKQIPPSTEAIACAMFRNVRQRVIDQVEWKSAEENKGKDLPSNLKRAEGTGSNSKERFPALYSTALCGQNLLGGWHAKPGKPGIKYFMQMKKKIRKARQGNKSKLIEKHGLDNARKIGEQVEGDSWKEWQKIRARKRRGLTATCPTDNESDIEWDDHEED